MKSRIIFFAVHITSTNIIIKVKKDVNYTFRPNQKMEVTLMVDVGEDAAVGDINGITLINLAIYYR